MKVGKFIETWLQDFDIEFRFFEYKDHWPTLRVFTTQIDDIGHSDKVICLGGKEI
jgi:hypothetical protein